jgi:1,4-dihydroxy-6-naphthoate synthase
MACALRFSRSSDASITDRFVGMYVNELSFDFGDGGRQAIAELLRRAQAVGAFDQPVKTEFVARGLGTPSTPRHPSSKHARR